MNSVLLNILLWNILPTNATTEKILDIAVESVKLAYMIYLF